MSEDNKALIRHFIEDGFNGRDLAVIDEVVAPDFVNHTPPIPNLPGGPAGMKQVFEGFFRAFPDVRLRIRELVAEGSTVAMFLAVEGTHEGDLEGIPATGRRISVAGMDFFRVEGGQIRERWGVFDQTALLEQLGVAASAVTL